MKPYILTRSGKQFYFLNPTYGSICIEDIAWSLASIARFNGHTSGNRTYTVAQHSVLVSGLVPPELALFGLLHDAHEAYIGDISSPLKSLLPDYQLIERKVEQAVRSKFGLAYNTPPAVRRADLIALAIEKRDLMPEDSEPWALLEGIEAPSYLAIPP